MKCKTILITGAGSGIGKDSAFALARRGHAVIATTETQAQADALAEEASKEDLSFIAYKLDITNEQDRTLILQHDLDVLINNAGIGETGPLAEVPMERIRKNFETNVFSTIAMAQLALTPMIKKGHGTVIVVSSLAGRLPFPFFNPYSMTKFALSGGVAAMRREVHAIAPNVHLSLIEPGAYATGFNQRMFETKYKWMNEESSFFNYIPMLRKNEKQFARMEQKNTQSIVGTVLAGCRGKFPTPSL